MASIRVKLTAAYAGALAVSMVAFGLALWLGRHAGVLREQQRVVFAQADIALRIIRAHVADSLPSMEVTDSLVGPLVRLDLAEQLEVVPGYLLVLDHQGRLVFASPAARDVRGDDLALLVRAARQLQAPHLAAEVTLEDDKVLIAGRLVNEPGSLVERVVAGAGTSALERQWERELLGTMLAVAPFLMAVSIGGAYVIAGRAFAPVDQLISDLAAITDGRSLHRRLAVDDAGNELVRLTQTLNAMIGRLENYFGALRRFTADASHELKTPLTVLRADVERAMSASTPSAERLVALEEALQETTRMADLVEQLLTLARADEGRFDLHREPVAMEPLIRDVFETAVILGESSGLAVTLPVAEEAMVLGDRTRLRQLFLNLISNAVKYTPRGGSVELTLRRHPASASFSVRDTGIGIAAADLPYVFERFWRADRVRSRASERGGVGLGLAISQWIAQAHGGTLVATSRLTRGSIFTVTLPLAGEPGSLEPVLEESSLATVALRERG